MSVRSPVFEWTKIDDWTEIRGSVTNLLIYEENNSNRESFSKD
jgi:hypothetical protein